MRSSDVPWLRPEQRWSCPNCPAEHVTREAQPHTPFHPCPGLNGLSAPFVAAGTKAKVVAHEREDYVGQEVVTRDGEGRVVMNVTTTRDDGEDVAVFAPCATVRADG